MTDQRKTTLARYDSNSAETSKISSRTLTQATFLALGVSSLLPWNALIITLPFFLERLEGTPFHDSFPSWLSFLFNGVALLAMGLATWLGDRRIGPTTIDLSLSTLLVIFGVLAVIPFLDFPPILFFCSVIFAGSALAASGGLLQTATVSIAPTYAPSAITSFMAGSALCAVGVSALQVFMSAGFEFPPSWSAVICFGTAGVLCSLTLSLYQVLRTATTEPADSYDSRKDIPVSEHTLLSQPNLEPSGPFHSTDCTPISRSTNFGRNFSVFYAAVVTLALFPAITTLIEPNRLGANPLVFNALHFLVFNVADLIGRFLTSAQSPPTDDTFLVIYSIARTAFGPLFLICNIPGHWPVLITSDVAYMLIVFLFGLTCGHCTTLALVSASKAGPRAARVTQVWMMLGFAVGGVVSFGVAALL